MIVYSKRSLDTVSLFMVVYRKKILWYNLFFMDAYSKRSCDTAISSFEIFFESLCFNSVQFWQNILQIFNNDSKRSIWPLQMLQVGGGVLGKYFWVNFSWRFDFIFWHVLKWLNVSPKLYTVKKQRLQKKISKELIITLLKRQKLNS